MALPAFQPMARENPSPAFSRRRRPAAREIRRRGARDSHNRPTGTLITTGAAGAGAGAVRDANGFMTSGAGRVMTATTFDMAASITDGANSATFSYDSEHARYKMVTVGVNAGTTYYLNDPVTGAMEQEVIAGGTTTWNDYISAEGKLAAERFCTGAAPCSTGATVEYFILDHLGSVSVIVSSTGALLNQLSYDAWGKRRNPDGSAINCTAGAAPPSSVTRGFTGQEMLDGVCLINMNARVYDPSLGRFMGADPTVGDETVPQELNRYSYVLNNPLSLTDPSGLCSLGCFLFGPLWSTSWGRDILGIAAAIVLDQPQFLGVINGALGLTNLSAGLVAVVDGGIVGGVSGVITTGTVKGLALGALQGALFAEAGNLLKPNAPLGNGFLGLTHGASEFVAHGLVGGMVSEIGSGRFGSGFLAGGFSSLTPAPLRGQSWEATFDGTVESAILGGIGSELGGGKFQDGAITGAFGYLFNDAAHNGKSPGDRHQLGVNAAIADYEARGYELISATPVAVNVPGFAGPRYYDFLVLDPVSNTVLGIEVKTTLCDTIRLNSLQVAKDAAVILEGGTVQTTGQFVHGVGYQTY